MNIKAIAAASVIALLPATSFASITVDTEGSNGVDFLTLNGSSVSTSTPTGDINPTILGSLNALDWNMRVINTGPPPGNGNSDGVAEFGFTVSQDASISVTSTQNPFAGLTGLALTLQVNGNSFTNNFSANGDIWAAVDTNALKVKSGDSIIVRASWASMSAQFNEVDVDFSLTASDFDGSDVPLPASALLLVGALGGLGLMARRKKA